MPDAASSSVALLTEALQLLLGLAQLILRLPDLLVEAEHFRMQRFRFGHHGNQPQNFDFHTCKPAHVVIRM